MIASQIVTNFFFFFLCLISSKGPPQYIEYLLSQQWFGLRKTSSFCQVQRLNDVHGINFVLFRRKKLKSSEDIDRCRLRERFVDKRALYLNSC